MFVCFVTKHACDGQTDGENYVLLDCASIAALRSKTNHSTISLKEVRIKFKFY